MLTKLRIRNFKQFDDVEIELGQNVVFIGANNSGKTSALQAIFLWHRGMKEWLTKRGVDKIPPPNRPGVAINRLSLSAIPTPNAKLLWKKAEVGRSKTKLITITLSGVSDSEWICALDFRYMNEESINCTPHKVASGTLMHIPEQATKIQIVLLPAMSGLTINEDELKRISIDTRIGQGRTAEVLRNLCYILFSEQKDYWQKLLVNLKTTFGIQLLPPNILPNGNLQLEYKDRDETTLDLSSAGRGMLQVLLLLTYMYVNPGAVLLLDEPDAHLEIIRQREIYSLLTSVAREQGSQIIAATHSEIIMEEAAKKDVVIAFVGKPHRANDRRSQVEKALKSIPFDHYYQAERVGWVLYIEGSTDISILKGLARKLNHETANLLDEVFVQPVNTNVPQLVRDHFYGLQEAKPDLVGYALFDRLEKQLGTDQALTIQMWRQREIENYLCTPETLITFAREYRAGNVFSSEHVDQREVFMRESINEIEIALRTLRRPPAWSADIKATDDFLDPLFDTYFSKLKLPNLLLKTNYHVLTEFVPVNLIDPEVTEKLDAIVAVAKRAKPRED